MHRLICLSLISPWWQVSRLMDLIVHSLYSNKEVFLRELIRHVTCPISYSNANSVSCICYRCLHGACVKHSFRSLFIRILETCVNIECANP